MATSCVRLMFSQPGIALVRRRGADAVAPVEDRRQVDGGAVPERGALGLENLVAVALRRKHAGVGVDEREAGHRGQPVRRFVDQDAVLVAARQLVADVAVRAFDEGRRAERVVDGDAVVGDEGIRRIGVGEALNQPRPGQDARALTGVLARDPQLRRELVVEANRRLLLEVLDRGRCQLLVVVVRCQRPALRRQRVARQEREARRVQPVLRNAAEDAAVLEAARGVGRVHVRPVEVSVMC